MILDNHALIRQTYGVREPKSTLYNRVISQTKSVDIGKRELKMASTDQQLQVEMSQQSEVQEKSGEQPSMS